jgi:biotin operon repressor
MSGTAVAKKLKRSRGAVAQKAMKLRVRFRSVKRKRA